jgi:putative spermidine/putrescine transport system permease protein
MPRDFLRKAVAAVVGSIFVFPLGYLAVLSVAREWSFPHLLPPRLDLTLWRNVVTPAIAASLGASTVIALTVAVLSTVAGFITSRSIAYHPRRSLLVLFAYAPFSMSPVILGTCLLFLFIKLGLDGSALGIVLGQFIFCYGYAVILFLGFWNARIRALEELVFTLGGSRRQAFTRMLMPVAREMLLVCFFQTFLLSWFDYGLALVIGSGKIQTLTMKVYEYVSSGNFYLAAICSLLLIVPPLAMLLLNRRLLVERV